MRNQLKYGIAQTEPKTMNQLKIDGFLKWWIGIVVEIPKYLDL